MIAITRQQYLTSAATHYTAVRNGATYYMHDNYGGVVTVDQRYIKRNGTPGQRRLPAGKLHDELVAALQQHKSDHPAV